MQTQKSNWKYRLFRLLEDKEEGIAYCDSNYSSRRIEDAPGLETEYMGFRACIFYFKLSTLIDMDLTSKIIKEISKHIGPPSKHKFATFFLNDSSNKLIHPSSSVRSEYEVRKIVKHFYEKHAEENELFSGVLEHLFPGINLYSDVYPDHEDLCLIISDRYGVEMAPRVLSKVKPMKKNWIYICADKKKPVEVVDLKKVI